MFSKHKIYPDINNIQLAESIQKNIIFQDINNTILESLKKYQESIFFKLEFKRLYCKSNSILNFFNKSNFFNFLRIKAYKIHEKKILKDIIEMLENKKIKVTVQYDSFTLNYKLHLLHKKTSVFLIIDNHYLYNYLFKSESETKRDSFFLAVSMSQGNKKLTSQLSIFSSQNDHLILCIHKSVLYLVESVEVYDDFSGNLILDNPLYDRKNKKEDSFFN